MTAPQTVPPPLPWALLQLPRLVGVVILAAAIGLVATAPRSGELDTQTVWWSIWLSTASIGMVAYPLTMLVLWRNARKEPVLDAAGEPAVDPRGRPRFRRVERRGSRVLFIGLVLESASLLILAGVLLYAAGLG